MKRRTTTEFIVIHCSATAGESDIGATDIRKWHMEERGWSDIGYHYVIRRDGTIEKGRDITMSGAHVKGYNSRSVAVCMVGGVNRNGQPEDNFTMRQWVSLGRVLEYLKNEYPGAAIRGHRDFSPDLNNDGQITQDEWMKACPSFEVSLIAFERPLEWNPGR